jgi:hypothetical protein
MTEAYGELFCLVSAEFVVSYFDLMLLGAGVFVTSPQPPTPDPYGMGAVIVTGLP